MMTTMAALLGAVPLALGSGAGSELRRPLGVTIIGGLIVSQCLTLFTTPVIYLFFEWLRLAMPGIRRWLLEAIGLGRYAKPIPPQTGTRPRRLATRTSQQSGAPHLAL